MVLPIEATLEAVADATGTAAASWVVPTGKTVELSRLIAEGNSVVQPPSSEEGSMRFRGQYSGIGPLRWSHNFTEPMEAIKGMSRTGELAGGWSNSTAILPDPSGFKPPFSHMAFARLQGNADATFLDFDASKIPALSGIQITMVEAWVMAWSDFEPGSYPVMGTRVTPIMVGQLQVGNRRRWHKLQGYMAAGSFLTSFAIGARKDATLPAWRHNEVHVTGLRVYGRSADQVYILNDTVTHRGYVWLCVMSGTVQEPGMGTDWEQIEGTMATVGNPELRVLRNGVLMDHTGNANADVSSGNTVTLNAGDVIRAHWSKCSGGASMRLTIEGMG